MEDIYAANQIAIQNILARKYYNPLGELPFEQVPRLLSKDSMIDVLDVGCGRGYTTKWWLENTFSRVDAFDPSSDILDSAKQLLRTDKMYNVRFKQDRIDSFVSDRQYDLILMHDVLCYSYSFISDYARVLSWAKSGAIISLSGYYCEARTTNAASLIESWEIQDPPSLSTIYALLRKSPIQVLSCQDTSYLYFAHWKSLRKQLEKKWHEIVSAVGTSQAISFQKRVHSILAVESEKSFGHWWAIIRKD